MMRRSLSLCLVLVFLLARPAAAATRHVCTFVSTPAVAATPVYASVSCMVATNSSGDPWSPTEIPVPWLAAGTAKHLSITADVAPGVGKSRTITLRKGGADTALTVTLSGTNTTATDSTHVVTLAVGDTLDLSHVATSAPSGTNISISWTFDSTNTGESAYAIAPQSAAPGSGGTSYVPAFSFSNNHWSSAQLLDTVPIAATMTRYDVTMTVAPGTGKSWTLAWVKNGAVQDGTAGSTDTRITVANAATTGTWSGSLALSPGDTAEVQITAAGTPNTTNLVVAFGSRLVATTDGQSVLCGESEDDPSTSAVNYQQVLSTTAHGTFPWSATESLRQATIGPDGFALSNFYLWFRPGFNPGTAKSWTFDLRQNATSSSNPSVTISGSATTGNDTTHSLTFAGGDTFDIRSTPSGTPSTPSWTVWCMAQTASPAPAPGATSFPALTIAP